MKDILYEFSEQDHRNRLFNIRQVERQMTRCAKKEQIFDYEPGQFIYPGLEPGKPEEDEALFKKMSEAGVKYMYLWSGWAAKENKWGGDDMYAPKDPEATKEFLALAHKYGLRVLPYTSSNFFKYPSKHFNADWAWPLTHPEYLDNMLGTTELAHCSPTSPGWRELIFKMYTKLLDNYDFDGLYVDSGYFRRSDYLESWKYYYEEPVMVKDEVLAFREEADHDGGMEDFLSILYHEVKKRNKTMTVFKEGCDRFYTDSRISDYMLAGEAAKDIDFVRSKIWDFPHVMLDFSPAEPMDEMEYYLNSMPFLHFPILKKKAITVPNQDAIIPKFDESLEWVKLFKEMTHDATWCYIDIDCPKLVKGELDDVVVTCYVNSDFYMLLANYSHTDSKKIHLRDNYVDIYPNRPQAEVPHDIILKPRELKVLKITSWSEEAK